MKRVRLPRVLALLAPLSLLLPACTIDGLDELASGGNDDDDDDEEEEEETEGEEESDTEGDDDPKPSIESGDEPNESGNEPNSESASESATEGGEESSGGWDPSETSGWDPETGGELPGDDACVSYCTVELACDAVYASVDECVQACGEQTASAGACADSFAGMNLCLGSLGCEDFAAFWAALAALENGEDVGSFPCDVALIEFAQCAEGGAGAGA